MESPLRYLSSDECSSAWLKFHLGLPNQSSQRSINKRPNPQQRNQQQQQQHLNTLGLRLNAAGKIKPSVVNMPSMEHRWKIHYSYKTKTALTRSINTEDAVTVDQPASQRSAREWSRSESGKRSPHDAGRERTNRVRSAASGAVLARGREQQRSPRNHAGTPELVTTTPIRLLGVLRSPEHAPLNWRGNDGQQQPPRYFVFPPVTGSRPGATPLVRRERRVQASTAPVEARSRSGLEKENLPMTFTRSSSSESLPSSWKYADGRQTTTITGTDVTDDRTPHHTSQSTETLVLPTIDEEDAAAAASEASHRISVRISRNNSFNNRYNNNWNNNDNHQRLVESDELRMRVDENVDEDASDSLSVYDDDSEGDAAEAEPKPSSPVLAIAHVDDEGINGDQNEDHIEDQNEDHIGDQHEDQIVDQSEDHIGVEDVDHKGNQNEDHIEDQIEANIGDQNEDQIVDQSEDHIGVQDVDHNGNQNEDHIGDQSEDHIGNQNEDHNGGQNSDQNADLSSENLNSDQNEHLNHTEKTDSRKCCENDYQENEAWTKEATDFSTQRAVYPPLTSRGRASESPPPIPRDIPTADESHTAIETTHITDKQQDSPENKVLGEIRQVQGVGELVEDWKEVGANDVGSPEESSYKRRDQDISDERDEGDSNSGRQQREEESGELLQTVECRNLKDTTDENNNIPGITQDRNEVKNGNGEQRETSNDTETRIEADPAKVVEFDNPELLTGNVDVIGAESKESKIKTVEQLKSIATELSNATDSQSDLGSKANHPSATDHLDDLGQQQNGASPDLEAERSFTDEKVDGSSVESASLESTIEERRSPAPTGKAAVARKRSVRFSQDVVTVYLYMPVTPTPDDSDTSDSGFLSP